MTGSPSRGRALQNIRTVGLLAGLLMGCPHNEPSRAPPPTTLAAPDRPPPWDLAAGKLPEGCETTGTVPNPVVCSHARSDEDGFEKGLIDRVGGDYWKTRVASEDEVSCWMRTAPGSGAIASPAFAPSARWLTFAVRREVGTRTRVELRDGDRVVAITRPAVGGSKFVRVVWDLSKIFPDKDPSRRVRLTLVDEDPDCTLEVADITVTDSLPPTPSPDSVDPRDRLWGFADLHAHLFASMGFGGQLFWGDIHSAFTAQGFSGVSAPSVPSAALGVCSPMHGSAPDGSGVMFLMPPEKGHDRHGFPSFLGFPRSTSVYHQQAYLDWLLRAYHGGLRVLQADALNYPFLQKVLEVSRVAGPGTPANPTDDEWNITEQIKAAAAFADLPDVKPYLGIARSAAGARLLVRNGRLAMVLGTETESLGKLDAKVAEASGELEKRAAIQGYLGCLHERGVRHVIPVHLSENAFGAPAVYNVEFDLGQAAMAQKHFALRKTDPGEGIFYTRDADWTEADDLIKFLASLRIVGTSIPPKGPVTTTGHAHASGLTAGGRLLFEEMMRLGMIIDVEHLSALGVDEVLALAERFRYPVISSHTGFRATALGPDAAKRPQSWPSERAKSEQQMRRIAALGGLVGVGTGPSPSRTDPDVPACDGTSTGFVAALRYANRLLGGRGVALGTDINGFGQQVSPRFGPRACFGAGDDKGRKALLPAQRAAQKGGVAYSDKTPIVRHDWDRFVAENRSASVNGKEVYLTEKERRAWQSVARLMAGKASKVGVSGDRDPSTVQRWARGMWLARTVGKLLGDDARSQEIASGYWGCVRAGAACLSREPEPVPRLSPEVDKASATLASVLVAWKSMSGPNAPLVRSTMGDADFDFNIDGLAHYGLLPDLLQDAKNLGATEDEMASLFQGAEAFVAMWERAERAAADVNKALPPSVCATSPGKCKCDAP